MPPIPQSAPFSRMTHLSPHTGGPPPRRSRPGSCYMRRPSERTTLRPPRFFRPHPASTVQTPRSRRNLNPAPAAAKAAIPVRTAAVVLPTDDGSGCLSADTRPLFVSTHPCSGFRFSAPTPFVDQAADTQPSPIDPEPKMIPAFPPHTTAFPHLPAAAVHLSLLHRFGSDDV